MLNGVCVVAVTEGVAVKLFEYGLRELFALFSIVEEEFEVGFRFWCAGFEDVTALAFRREAGLDGYQLVVGIVDIRYLAGSAAHRRFSQKLVDQKVVETFRGFLIGRDPRGPVDVFSTEDRVGHVKVVLVGESTEAVAVVGGVVVAEVVADVFRLRSVLADGGVPVASDDAVVPWVFFFHGIDGLVEWAVERRGVDAPRHEFDTEVAEADSQDAPWDDVLDVEDLHFWAAKDGDAAGGFFRKPGVNKGVALEFGFVPVVDATYAGHMRLLNESYAVLELAGC